MAIPGCLIVGVVVWSAVSLGGIGGGGCDWSRWERNPRLGRSSTKRPPVQERHSPRPLGYLRRSHQHMPALGSSGIRSLLFRFNGADSHIGMASILVVSLILTNNMQMCILFSGPQFAFSGTSTGLIFALSLDRYLMIKIGNRYHAFSERKYIGFWVAFSITMATMALLLVGFKDEYANRPFCSMLAITKIVSEELVANNLQGGARGLSENGCDGGVSSRRDRYLGLPRANGADAKAIPESSRTPVTAG